MKRLATILPSLAIALVVSTIGASCGEVQAPLSAAPGDLPPPTPAPPPTPPSPTPGYAINPPNQTSTGLSAPQMIWNAFLGGRAVGHDIAIDSGGNSYVSGYSDGPWGNPVRGFTGSRDAFVAKVDGSGNLIWDTFLGGNGWAYGGGIAVDSNGNVYVTGLSTATWGSPLRAYTPSASNAGLVGNDAFVAKIDSRGNLAWNTFLGGAGDDEGHDISVAGNGDIYVAGMSGASWGSPLRAWTASAHAFVAKLDGSGDLKWNTFFDGSGADAIAMDSYGNVYVAGTRDNHAVAYKLDGAGSLTWSTILGGGGHDFGWGITVDNRGGVYVSGTSDTTWGNPVRPYTSGQDAFVARLADSGSLVWNTFLGGSGDDTGDKVAVDSTGTVCVAGESDATWGNPARPYSASTDGFVAALDKSGRMVGNTFLGGTGDDFASGVAADRNGNVYVTGYSTASWGSPVRAYTSCDAFVAKLNAVGSTKIATGLTDAQLITQAQQAARGKAQPQDAENQNSCLVYAQRRGLGVTAQGNTGAFNILYQGNDARLGANNQPTASLKPEIIPLQGVRDLTTILHPGDFIVWQRDVAQADPTYGHVAVVELVETGRVVISEAGWPDDFWRVLHTSTFAPGTAELVPGMYGYPNGLP